MNVAYCPTCQKDTESDNGTCLTCYNKYSKRDLLALIEQQHIIIDSLEDQLHLAEYTVGTILYPEYFTVSNIH